MLCTKVSEQGYRNRPLQVAHKHPQLHRQGMVWEQNFELLSPGRLMIAAAANSRVPSQLAALTTAVANPIHTQAIKAASKGCVNSCEASYTIKVSYGAVHACCAVVATSVVLQSKQLPGVLFTLTIVWLPSLPGWCVVVINPI